MNERYRSDFVYRDSEKTLAEKQLALFSKFLSEEKVFVRKIGFYSNFGFVKNTDVQCIRSHLAFTLKKRFLAKKDWFTLEYFFNPDLNYNTFTPDNKHLSKKKISLVLHSSLGLELTRNIAKKLEATREIEVELVKAYEGTV